MTVLPPAVSGMPVWGGGRQYRRFAVSVCSSATAFSRSLSFSNSGEGPFLLFFFFFFSWLHHPRAVTVLWPLVPPLPPLLFFPSPAPHSLRESDGVEHMQRLQSILLSSQRSVVRRQMGASTRSILGYSALATDGVVGGKVPSVVRGRFMQAPYHPLQQQPLALRCLCGGSRVARFTPAVATPMRSMHTDAKSDAAGGFLRSSRLSRICSSPFSRSDVAGSLRFTPFCIPHRCMSVRGKDGKGSEEESRSSSGDSEQKPDEQERRSGEGNAEEEEETADGKTKAKGKQKKQKPQAKRNSFADHIRGLKEDYAKFPDIYNSANGINFVIFIVFCLCSTGSNTEEKWWMEQWGLDNTCRPWNWLLHSFLTNNFLSMTYAMMLLHTLCHAMIPTLGSKGLLAYVVSTAVLSGAIMYVGNALYYGDKAAPEKQFGPWDVVHALFVMYYLQYAITPIAVLNSFNSWLKYAVWVGEICILYFDWQPTLVGTLVGLALCKGTPYFRVKPMP